jgi:N-hydroxyarylamine O-acetyltransferase
MEQLQNGHIYRLTSLNSEDGLLGLEAMVESRWKRQYAFTLQPRELSEFAGMCHYHQTSPESHFTRQRICSLATPEGRVTLSDGKLIETRAGSRWERPLAGDEEWRVTLREQFGVILPE